MTHTTFGAASRSKIGKRPKLVGKVVGVVAAVMLASIAFAGCQDREGTPVGPLGTGGGDSAASGGFGAQAGGGDAGQGGDAAGTGSAGSSGAGGTTCGANCTCGTQGYGCCDSQACLTPAEAWAKLAGSGGIGGSADAGGDGAADSGTDSSVDGDTDSSVDGDTDSSGDGDTDSSGDGDTDSSGDGDTDSSVDLDADSSADSDTDAEFACPQSLYSATPEFWGTGCTYYYGLVAKKSGKCCYATATGDCCG